MWFFYIFYGFLGAIIWAVVTQPSHTQRTIEKEKQIGEVEKLGSEINELKEKIVAIEKKLSEANMQKDNSTNESDQY